MVVKQSMEKSFLETSSYQNQSYVQLSFIKNHNKIPLNVSNNLNENTNVDTHYFG